MALQKSIIKVVFGETMEFVEAYHQITNVVGDKNKLTYTFTVYKDNTKNIVVDSKMYDFIPDSAENTERWDKQCYEHAKTLQEYSDAIDV